MLLMLLLLMLLLLLMQPIDMREGLHTEVALDPSRLWCHRMLLLLLLLCCCCLCVCCCCVRVVAVVVVGVADAAPAPAVAVDAPAPAAVVAVGVVFFFSRVVYFRKAKGLRSPGPSNMASGAQSRSKSDPVGATGFTRLAHPNVASSMSSMMPRFIRFGELVEALVGEAMRQPTPPCSGPPDASLPL